MAAASSSSAPAAQAAGIPIPQHFDHGVDEAVDEAKVETDKVFAEANRQAARRETAIQGQIARNLGPSSETADASYVARLAADANKGRQPKTYGPARTKPGLRETMDKTHQATMGKFWRGISSHRKGRLKDIPPPAESQPPPAGMEPIKPKAESRPEAIQRRLHQAPWGDKASKLEPAAASSSGPAAQKSRSRSAGITPRAASEPPLIKPKAESRAAAIKRRLTGKQMDARAASEPSAATKASTRSRSRGEAKYATEPAPAPRIRKGERSPLQSEVKKTRRRSKSSPAEASAPPEAKATTAAYPAFWAPAAKVAAKAAAKLAAKVAAKAAPAAAAKAAPAVAAAKGPTIMAADMGTAIDFNNDPAYWQTKTVGVLHDQLSLRGYRTTLSATAFGRTKKADLVKLLISTPIPKQKT